MDVGYGEHHVDLLALGILDRLPHGVDIGASRACQRGDHRSPDLASDTLHRVEIAGRREGEAGLDDVNAQAGELPGDRHLLIRCQRCAGGLLAVAQRRIEDKDAVARGLRYGGLHQLLAFLSAFSHGLIARRSEPTFSINSLLARRRQALKAGRPAWFSTIQVRAKAPAWIS